MKAGSIPDRSSSSPGAAPAVDDVDGWIVDFVVKVSFGCFGFRDAPQLSKYEI